MARKRYSGNKYGSKKVEVNGIVFDSKKEAKRYQELLLLEKAGAIRNLQRQVKYVLIPAQYGVIDGKRKCIERECSYVADFVYQKSILIGEPYMTEPLETVVEDTKGFRTKDYIIKRKLMLKVHGIRITEI